MTEHFEIRPHFISVSAEPNFSRYDLQNFLDIEEQTVFNLDFAESVKNTMGIVLTISDLRQLGFIPKIFTGTAIILPEEEKNRIDEQRLKHRTDELLKQNTALWCDKYTKLATFNKDLLVKMKEMKECYETQVLSLKEQLSIALTTNFAVEQQNAVEQSAQQDNIEELEVNLSVLQAQLSNVSHTCDDDNVLLFPPPNQLSHNDPSVTPSETTAADTPPEELIASKSKAKNKRNRDKKKRTLEQDLDTSPELVVASVNNKVGLEEDDTCCAAVVETSPQVIVDEVLDAVDATRDYSTVVHDDDGEEKLQHEVLPPLSDVELLKLQVQQMAVQMTELSENMSNVLIRLSMLEGSHH